MPQGLARSRVKMSMKSAFSNYTVCPINFATAITEVEEKSFEIYSSECFILPLHPVRFISYESRGSPIFPCLMHDKFVSKTSLSFLITVT